MTACRYVKFPKNKYSALGTEVQKYMMICERKMTSVSYLTTVLAHVI
jgi:hypothetical protein